MEVPIELDSNEDIKTLGLLWHPLSYQLLISKETCAEKLRDLPAKELFLLSLQQYLIH
jgi:hypothetical protein